LFTTLYLCQAHVMMLVKCALTIALEGKPFTRTGFSTVRGRFHGHCAARTIGIREVSLLSAMLRFFYFSYPLRSNTSSIEPSLCKLYSHTLYSHFTSTVIKHFDRLTNNLTLYSTSHTNKTSLFGFSSFIRHDLMIHCRLGSSLITSLCSFTLQLHFNTSPHYFLCALAASLHLNHN
jgi:hypothetical protein